MTDITAAETPAKCCGKDSWTKKGGPLAPSCQLCSASPTYWRNTRTPREQDALGYKLEVPGDR